MKNLPLTTDPFALAARFLVLQSAEKEINYIISLLCYKDQGVITQEAVHQLSNMVSLDKRSVFNRLGRITDTDQLTTYCAFIADMRRFGFLTKDDLWLINVEANMRFRAITDLKPIRKIGKSLPIHSCN